MPSIPVPVLLYPVFYVKFYFSDSPNAAPEAASNHFTYHDAWLYVNSGEDFGPVDTEQFPKISRVEVPSPIYKGQEVPGEHSLTVWHREGVGNYFITHELTPNQVLPAKVDFNITDTHKHYKAIFAKNSRRLKEWMWKSITISHAELLHVPSGNIVTLAMNNSLMHIENSYAPVNRNDNLQPTVAETSFARSIFRLSVILNEPDSKALIDESESIHYTVTGVRPYGLS